MGQSDLLNVAEPPKFTHFHHHEPRTSVWPKPDATHRFPWQLVPTAITLPVVTPGPSPNLFLSGFGFESFSVTLDLKTSLVASIFRSC